MSRRNLIKYCSAMVEAGVMEKPLWLDAMKRVGVVEHRVGRRPPRIDFPEDRLLSVYYQKYPEAKLEPLDLTSYEPPAARRFVMRQQQLMAEQGLERKAAFAAVEAENEARGLHPGGVSAAALASSTAAGAPGSSIIEAIQAEEEAELNAGLSSFIDRHGPIQAPKRFDPSRRFVPGAVPRNAGGLPRNPYSERLRNMQAIAGALKQQPAAGAAAAEAGSGGSAKQAPQPQQ